MPRRATATGAAALTLAFLATFPAGSQPDREAELVFVTNFPAVQQVGGTVGVDGPVRHARMDRRAEILVPPVGPQETTRLIPAGTLATDGFTAVVLSLSGQTKGRALKPGRIGAILIPDEEPIERAFDEEGQTQFPIEISAATTGRSHFASTPERSMVAFPRYRVLLFNTTDRTATVHLFAYLTNG
ncbi:MAG: hypothetical protein ACRD5D_08800 [Candidatus Polarisedimenticolia bacterium]